MNKVLVIAALLLLVPLAVGQNPPASEKSAPAEQTAPAPDQAAAAPAPVKNPITTALKDTLPARQKNTIAAVELMPAEKFTYKPTPAQVTFGHLVSHMIEANYLLCGGASGFPASKPELATESEPKEKLVSALKASFDFCSEALAKMDDSRLGEITQGPNDQQLSRARFALGIASNWADHYAEAAMYLRLNGLTPPTAKK
jgi:DinB superfamily